MSKSVKVYILKLLNPECKDRKALLFPNHFLISKYQLFIQLFPSSKAKNVYVTKKKYL